MKRSRQAPHVIIVTGGGDERVAVRAIRAGADDYLIKYDVVTDKLYEIVEEHLPGQARTHPAEPGADSIFSRENDSGKVANLPATPAPASLEIPGYKIISVLAQRLSHTFLADYLADGKKVVLKVQDLRENSSAVLLKRFIQELNILSRLDHPHVIKVLDHGFTDKYFYYAVDYCPQGDLAGAISRGEVTSDKACAYILQIASGLSALHAAGIVHRDLKPGNILFAGADLLVISDLGIAKDLSCAEVLTAHGVIMGTPFYMSPEQINGKELDQRSDIYSMGVIFYEMLTGRLPYQGSSIMEMALKHTYDAPPPLPEALAIYNPVMDRLLQKSPEDRYQDLDQFIQDVSKCTSG
jgi:serine/threonine-protein kinase PpkA